MTSSVEGPPPEIWTRSHRRWLRHARAIAQHSQGECAAELNAISEGLTKARAADVSRWEQGKTKRPAPNAVAALITYTEKYCPGGPPQAANKKPKVWSQPTPDDGVDETLDALRHALRAGSEERMSAKQLKHFTRLAKQVSARERLIARRLAQPFQRSTDQPGDHATDTPSP